MTLVKGGRLKILTMTTFALVLGLTAASAEHGLIRDNDKDGDKKLSWAEIEPIGWSKEMLELKDMDGALDEGELAKIPQASDQRKFKSKSKKAKKS